MRKILAFFVICYFSLPVVWPFFQKGFFQTHDIVYLTRMAAASNALPDGQIPMRWVSGFRYGEPLFNYYAPFPYYVSSFIHSFGFDFTTTAKILFVAITLSSGFFMYLLAKEYWGKIGGLLAALLYSWAPYRAVNYYIRGAYSESFAFIFLPTIFWSIFKYSKRRKSGYLVISAIAIAALITTHNITALIFMPFIFLYLAYLIIKFRNTKLILPFLLSIIFGLLLSAFFWLPAIVEMDFVKSRVTVLSFDFFVNQFVHLKDFFIPQWGRAIIPHELGYAPILAVGIGLLAVIAKKKRTKSYLFILIMLIISIFFQTIHSLMFWQVLPFGKFVQFPWRLSIVSAFLISLLGGSAVTLFQKKSVVKVFLLFFFLVLLFMNQSNYYRPAINQSFNDSNLINNQEAFLPEEYIPVWVKENPPYKLTQPVNEKFKPLEVSDIRQNSFSYTFSISLNKETNIVAPVYYFPGWRAFVNNKEISISKQPKTGLIFINAAKGDNQKIKLIITNTPIRNIANTITVISVLMIIVMSTATFCPKLLRDKNRVVAGNYARIQPDQQVD